MMKHEEYFSDIMNEAYNIDYNFEVDDKFNITLTGTKPEHLQPEIEVITHCKTTIEDGVVKDTYYFEVNIKFPEIRSGRFEFFDDAEYYLGHWQDIGRFVTDLLKKEITLDNNV